MYPIDLVRQFKNGEISRAEYCRRIAAMQGFNNNLKAYGDDEEIIITYRGRKAYIRNGCYKWAETNCFQTARNFKEMKIKIDLAELKK